MVTERTADDVELTVLEELESLLPPHSDLEAEEFRKSVEATGKFDDAIVYWGPDRVVIDGHKRLRLWESLPADTKIPPPKVREELLPDIGAVRKWMIRRQLGRRNLGENQLSILRGKLYNETKRLPGRPEINVVANDLINSPAEDVAEETNSTAETVRKDGAFVDALDAIGAVNGKAKADIESGSLKVSKADVRKIGKLDADGIGAAIKNLRNGRKWNDDGSGVPQKPETSGESIVRDELDREVPKHLRQHHELAARIKAAASKLDSVKKDVKELAGLAGGVFIPLQQVEIAIKDVKALIAQARYWTECPRCKGKPKDGCDRCDGHGFLPFARRGTLSDDDKTWLGVE
jgi:hypothetical protein